MQILTKNVEMDATEVFQAIEEIKNVNPGVIQTYLKGLVPDIVAFLIQMADEAGGRYRRQAVLGCTNKICLLFYIVHDDFIGVWGGNDLGSCIARLYGTDNRACIAGKPFQFCGWRADSAFETV